MLLLTTAINQLKSVIKEFLTNEINNKTIELFYACETNRREKKFINSNMLLILYDVFSFQLEEVTRREFF